MPRGIPEYKNRNSASRARSHRNEFFRDYARTLKTPEVKRLVREDLQTGRIEVVNRSSMNAEIWWSGTFERWNCLGLESSIAWAELERGATLHTAQAMFWLETNLAAAAA